MPYPTQASLPDAIKKLPAHAQDIWRKAYNSAFDQYDGDESKAAATAWAAVKTKYKQVEGEWVAKLELETVDLPNQEIFAAGDFNGIKYTEDDLNEIVNSFYVLKDRHKPALKLGHDDKQVISQNSGMPALGWVENIRRVGSKLLADFVQVPKRLQELIAAGAYKKLSSEIWWNLKDNGKVFKRALRAVALLGADVPAVWDLRSIEANYSFEENDIQEYKEVTFDMTGTKIKDDSKKKEEKEMEEMIKKLQKESEEAKVIIKKLEEDKAAAEKARKEAEENAAKEAKEKAEAKAEKEKIEAEAEAQKDNAFIDDKMSEGRVIPAQRDSLKTLMKEVDKTKVVKYTIKEDDKEVEKESNLKEMLKSFITNSQPQVILGEVAGGKGKNAFGTIEDAAEYYEKTEKMSYRDALKKASVEHPSLVEKVK